MAYPSLPAIAAIKAYVSAHVSGGWSASDAVILAAYNAPAVANPVPQATVPKPYTPAQLLACLSQASAANLFLFPAIYQLNVDMVANNTPNVIASLNLLAAAGKVTSAEATALSAILTATELDPSWTSQISQAQSDLTRAADEGDIAAARAAP